MSETAPAAPPPEESAPRKGLLRRGWAAGWRLFQAAQHLTLSLLPLAFGLLALVLVVREAAREPLEITEIAVPSALSDAGFTGQVAALRLLDAVNATARAVRAETMHRPSAELQGSEPDLNIPAAGISLRSLAALLRNLLGWPERRLSGEVTVMGDTLRLRLRLAGYGVVTDAEATKDEGPDMLLSRAAPEVWRVLAPRLYAWHIAQQDLDEGEIRERLYMLKRRVDDDDTETDATITYLIARSLARSGRPQEALEMLEPLLAHSPRRPAAHYGRAIALRAMGDHAGALEEQRRGLSLDRESAWAYLAVAELLRELGRFDEALASAREAQRLDDDDPDGPIEESNILRQMRRPAPALAAARRAVAVDPSYAPSHAALGHALYAQREYAAAISSYDTALRLSARLAEAHIGRAEALLALERVPEALAALGRAITLDANDPRPHRTRASAFRRMERWGEALEAYDAAIQRAPGRPELQFGRATVLTQLGRREEALAAVRRAVELGLNDPAAAALLRELGG